MPASELIETAGISPSVIATLKKRGLVEEFEQDIRRDPLALAELPETDELKLTAHQEAAFQTIEDGHQQRRVLTVPAPRRDRQRQD